MKTPTLVLGFTVLALLVALSAGLLQAQGPEPAGPQIQAPGAGLGSTFTYQGQLRRAGSVVSATCQMAFRLYDDPTAGSQVGEAITQAVAVSGGTFTAAVDLGTSAFAGGARWLGIRVQCPPDGGFTDLGRQALTAAPYALYALAAGGGWSLAGNGSTSPADFLGTTDSHSLTLRVSNTVALRLEPNATSANLIGGYGGNTVWPGVVGAVIAGGGASGAINAVSDDYCVVGGGAGNVAGASLATVGGGYSNQALENGSTVAGGAVNIAAAPYGAIGGGSANHASGYGSTVPGGTGNEAIGTNSLAAGYGAHAVQQGTFVWADVSTLKEFSSTAQNQFLIQAVGGVGINTNSPAATLDVSGTVRLGRGSSILSRVEGGTASLGTNWLGGTANYTVTFSTPFLGAPMVMATPRSSGDYTDVFGVTTRRVYTDRFVVNVYRLDQPGNAWGQSLQLDWFAWQ